MNGVNIFVKIEPTKTTHQSSLRVLRNKRGGFFVGKMSSSPHKKWCNEFERLISTCKPDKPFTNDCFVSISFYFPPLQSARKASKETRTFKNTRPDLDNLEKSVLDSLVRTGFLSDDSIVCQKFSQKFYDKNYGIKINIAPASLDLDGDIPTDTVVSKS